MIEIKWNITDKNVIIGLHHRYSIGSSNVAEFENEAEKILKYCRKACPISDIDIRCQVQVQKIQMSTHDKKN